MDRAYVDFERLNSGETDQSTGVLNDQEIMLTGLNTKQKYSECLRRERYFDAETKKTLVFLTNNFKISALTVAALYKSRWGIETFFKWIKQHLKIQAFWGQSEKAVKTQISIAISAYLVVIIAKKQLKLKYTLYEILQLISLAPFYRTPIKQLFENAEYQDVKEQKYIQLKLF